MQNAKNDVLHGLKCVKTQLCRHTLIYKSGHTGT